MENNLPSATRVPPALGPLPTSLSDRPVTRSQRVVLDALLAEDAPTPLSRLAETTGLHENTLRGHLEALWKAQLVGRERRPESGRGRPAWLWSAGPAARRTAPEYAGLAGTLARTLHRTSAHPADDAVEAGRAWGRDLARGRATGSARARRPHGPRAEVGDLLAELGFGPVPDAAGPHHPEHAQRAEQTLRLTHCPLLDVAREHPDVVCNVHLGLVAGALEGLGADSVDTALVPFAEPGACLLHLREVAG